jgi:hypothetical protein
MVGHTRGPHLPTQIDPIRLWLRPFDYGSAWLRAPARLRQIVRAISEPSEPRPSTQPRQRRPISTNKLSVIFLNKYFFGRHIYISAPTTLRVRSASNFLHTYNLKDVYVLQRLADRPCLLLEFLRAGAVSDSSLHVHKIRSLRSGWSVWMKTVWIFIRPSVRPNKYEHLSG